MTSNRAIKLHLNKVLKQVDRYLDKHLPKNNSYAGQLVRAMRYSIFAGGKRVRPALALASFQVCGGKGANIFYATSALEMLHTFSLIHDDLPCMDDDDFRRGRPTSHKVFGEATAVLAGDALCIHAFQLLAKTGNARCVETLAAALGTEGMIGGQIGDIMAEGREVGLQAVRQIHLRKTAALMEASLIIGAQLAGADAPAIRIFSSYGKKIGLAFQIVDDVLDLEQTTESLGKDAGSDTQKSKATFPAVIGVSDSKKKADALMKGAIKALEPLNGNVTILKELARFIVQRVH